MQIGKIIKQARLEKKITQEELAESLNVTTQAVSRWETGVSYPDITLIPTIANYLDVTADELLGVKLEERKRNIDNIIKENDDLINKRYLDDSLNLLKDALKKYPNDERLLMALTKCYWNRMIMTIDHEDMFEYRQELKKLIIETANKTLEITKDPHIIEEATIYLIHTYPRLGEEGRLKALEIVNKLPGIESARELRLTNVLKGEERKRRLQENMLLGIKIINQNFSYCLLEFTDDIDQQIELLKKNIDLIKLMIDGNLYWFNIPCMNYSFELATLHAQKKDKENTIKYLNDAVEYMQAVLNSPKEGEYDSYWLKGVPYAITLFHNFEGEYRSFEDEIYDFIKGDSEFAQIKNRCLQIYKARNNQ